jgi:hypothetical protein
LHRVLHAFLGEGVLVDLGQIGVEGLLAGNRSGESPKSFERWFSKRKSATD